jgi:hypothetical protein
MNNEKKDLLNKLIELNFINKDQIKELNEIQSIADRIDNGEFSIIEKDISTDLYSELKIFYRNFGKSIIEFITEE